MRLKRLSLGFAVVGGLALSGWAFAQSGTGETEVSKAASIDDVQTYGNIDASKVSIGEKKNRTEDMLGNQRKALARATEILAEARGAKDIVQLNCVNEKLTQIKGLLKISEQASLQMYEAIANGADDLVNHEYTKMTVAHQKSNGLLGEAEQCVGELSVYSGDTDVEVDIDSEGGGGGGGGEGGGASGGGGAGGTAASGGGAPAGPSVPPVASAS